MGRRYTCGLLLSVIDRRVSLNWTVGSEVPEQSLRHSLDPARQRVDDMIHDWRQNLDYLRISLLSISVTPDHLDLRLREIPPRCDLSILLDKP